MTATANPLCRLAPRSPAEQCAPSTRNCLIASFTRIPQQPDRSSRHHRLTGCHLHHRKSGPQTPSLNDQKLFNIHMTGDN
jgi:hypothetical protein